jgi:hypothetical protein
MSDNDQRLADFILQEGGEVAHDMANHVADQIFELLQRNGLMMRSEAGATAMLVLAARNVLAQAVDQCSRAAEDDCTASVLTLFLACQPENLAGRMQLSEPIA